MSSPARTPCWHALLMMMVCLSVSCAVRSGEAQKAPKVALPQHVSPPAAALHEPAGVTLPQGTCQEGFFLSGDERCVPLAWHCAPVYYNGGANDGCDCNCGAPDPDCDNPRAAKWCYKLGQTSSVPSCQACE